jgi:hypothetical protein
VKGEEVYFEKGMAAKSAEALTEATAGNPWQLGTVTTAGYWDGGVIWTLFFEIKADLGEDGAPVNGVVTASVQYEDATVEVPVDVINGVVTTPDGDNGDDEILDEDDEFIDEEITDEEITDEEITDDEIVEDEEVVEEEEEIVDDVTGTDIPKAGDVSSVAMAAGLCAVAAAAFVVIKKVND